ncbi:hypothetical protein P7C73_g4151, partial [Tremellales sp. Uapishka_1]
MNTIEGPLIRDSNHSAAPPFLGQRHVLGSIQEGPDTQSSPGSGLSDRLKKDANRLKRNRMSLDEEDKAENKMIKRAHLFLTFHMKAHARSSLEKLFDVKFDRYCNLDLAASYEERAKFYLKNMNVEGFKARMVDDWMRTKSFDGVGLRDRSGFRRLRFIIGCNNQAMMEGKCWKNMLVDQTRDSGTAKFLGYQALQSYLDSGRIKMNTRWLVEIECISQTLHLKTLFNSSPEEVERSFTAMQILDFMRRNKRYVVGSQGQEEEMAMSPEGTSFLEGSSGGIGVRYGGYSWRKAIRKYETSENKPPLDFEAEIANIRQTPSKRTDSGGLSWRDFLEANVASGSLRRQLIKHLSLPEYDSLIARKISWESGMRSEDDSPYSAVRRSDTDNLLSAQYRPLPKENLDSQAFLERELHV